jgi:hypothetical protein
MHYVIKCSVSYVISPPTHDVDQESRSNCVNRPEAHVSLNTSALYRVNFSQLKIPWNPVTK